MRGIQRFYCGEFKDCSERHSMLVTLSAVSIPPWHTEWISEHHITQGGN